MLSFEIKQEQTVEYYIFQWANGGLFLDYYRLFYITRCKYKLMKAQLVCLGFEPGAAGWKAQTNPLSYGGTSNTSFYQFGLFGLDRNTLVV